jgi:hypothetical protein
MRLHGGAVLGKDVGQAGRTGRCRTLPVRRGDGDGGNGGASYARKTTRLTGGAGLPVRGSARARGAGRWGWLVSEREREARGRLRARAGRLMGRRGGECVGAGEGGGGRDMGQTWPSRGKESFFFFFFLFLITHFHFVSFSF